MLMLSLLLLAANAPAAELEVSLERLRSARGVLHLCLTGNREHFPDCAKDPRALKRTVPASASTLRFTDIAPGRYALSVFHDENRNGKLDSFLGVPREGFGFSRNPVIRFGPPAFQQVGIDLRPGITRQTVRMQYLL